MTAREQAASLSSAATFPGVPAGRAAGQAWWAKPWTSTVGMFGGGSASKARSGPVETAADFFHRLCRQEVPRERLEIPVLVITRLDFTCALFISHLIYAMRQL